MRDVVTPRTRATPLRTRSVRAAVGDAASAVSRLRHGATRKHCAPSSGALTAPVG